ncbi:hypothetical protein [Egicoccus sp. AB-alg2]|uniref:hypothetical protein n=1 Tax=Egicoccus sp. AB-alg2 TaxID=3242693 RepID=UPI00359EB1C1
MPGSRRAVPDRLTDEQAARLRWLLEDPVHWVRRTKWEDFLLQGNEAVVVETDSLTSDQKVAALAWLRQQRHRLYAVLEGGSRAPDGWLESFPLYDRLGGEVGQVAAHRG